MDYGFIIMQLPWLESGKMDYGMIGLLSIHTNTICSNGLYDYAITELGTW